MHYITSAYDSAMTIPASPGFPSYSQSSSKGLENHSILAKCVDSVEFIKLYHSVATEHVSTRDLLETWSDLESVGQSVGNLVYLVANLGTGQF
mmetsp:Transcript_8987/g.14231  ORF Transcript_8987/g.14231 Transcript_8987/m.14231 type:complete len:93 (-) Transcript_8987:2465-2743(-)